LVSLELLGFLKHEISIISGISYKGCYNHTLSSLCYHNHDLAKLTLAYFGLSPFLAWTWLFRA
jgi:hypothetical protein